MYIATCLLAWKYLSSREEVKYSIKAVMDLEYILLSSLSDSSHTANMICTE